MAKFPIKRAIVDENARGNPHEQGNHGTRFKPDPPLLGDVIRGRNMGKDTLHLLSIGVNFSNRVRGPKNISAADIKSSMWPPIVPLTAAIVSFNPIF
jgi:hypothetical protein